MLPSEQAQMHSDLNALKIHPDEVEQIAGLDFSDSLAIATYQAIALRNSKQLLALVQAEFFLLLLTLIFLFPISLIALRNTGYMQHTAHTIPLLLTVFGLALLAIFVWNVYLWKHAQTLKFAARLAHYVNQFNAVIQTVHLIDKLSSACYVNPEQNELKNRQDAIAALQIAREHLVSALNAEKLIRQHQQRLLSYHHDMIAILEANVAKLTLLNADTLVSEYSHPINDVLQISMSVYREIANL